MKTDGPTALLLIDFQKGFAAPGWGARNNPYAEARAADLLAHWRAASLPVVHVRHLSALPDSPLRGPGADWIEGLHPAPDEASFEKSVNSAFIGTGLETYLRQRGIRALVIAGLTTPHCVSTSCRMAANLGFDVTLAHDACAAFAANADMGWQDQALTMDAEMTHASAVAHLHGEFVTASATQDIVRA